MFGKLFFTVQSCVVIWLFSFSLPLYFDYGFYAVNIVCFVSLWCIHISCISFPLQKESPLIKFSLVMFFFFNVNCHTYSFLTDTCNFFSLDVFFVIFGFLWFVFFAYFPFPAFDDIVKSGRHFKWMSTNGCSRAMAWMPSSRIF